MDNHVWKTSETLQSWVNKHSQSILCCDFNFDILHPDMDPLLSAISQCYGIRKETIFAGSGISQFIHSTLSLPIWNTVTLSQPEFGLYERIAQMSCNKNNLRTFTAVTKNDMLEYIKNMKSVPNDLLCFSSPRWYTGEMFTKNEIQDILSQFNGTILIDEAYVDYAKIEDNLLLLAAENERVIVLRSFSKGWFLSGLRVGFMVSCKFSYDYRFYGIVPHSISTPSARFVELMLQNKKLMQAFSNVRTDIMTLRDDFISVCQQHRDLYVLKSESNFVSLLFHNDDVLNLIRARTKDIISANPLNGPLNGIKYWISNKTEANKVIRILDENLN